MDTDLDLYELMLEVEDAFGFSVPVEEGAELSTMGKLYDYVLAHRFRGKEDACLTSMTFYALRRALMSVLQFLGRRCGPRRNCRRSSPNTDAELGEPLKRQRAITCHFSDGRSGS